MTCLDTDYPVFDAHVHVFPEKIAADTVAELGRRGGITPSFDGTCKGLEKSMKATGIKAALNCPVATRPEQAASINEWAGHLCWPVLSLGSVHPDNDAPVDVVRDVADKGLNGLKLHAEYQQFDLLDPRLYPVWEECQKMHFPVLLHTGADVAFPPPYGSPPKTVYQLHRMYPELPLIAAHLGGWHMWDEAEEYLIGHTDIYLDTAYVLQCMSASRAADLVRRHGVERVLFGSDAPWADQHRTLALFADLGLTRHEQEQILWKNARQLFRV